MLGQDQIFVLTYQEHRWAGGRDIYTQGWALVMNSDLVTLVLRALLSCLIFILRVSFISFICKSRKKIFAT